MLLGTGEPFEAKVDDLAFEMAVIVDNLDSYPEVETMNDLLGAMRISSRDRTDYLYSRIVREILFYNEETEDEDEKEITVAESPINTNPNHVYVELNCKGLYGKLKPEGSFQKVYKIGFLKLMHYTPGKNEAMRVLPYLGEKVEDVNRLDYESGITPTIMNAKSIRDVTSLDKLRSFLIFEGNAERFICGNTVYSILNGVLAQHGNVKYYNHMGVQGRLLQ